MAPAALVLVLAQAAGPATLPAESPPVITPEPTADLVVPLGHAVALSSHRALEWDGDPWYVNTLGHGLFGSELYLRARMCHALGCRATKNTSSGDITADPTFVISPTGTPAFQKAKIVTR